MTKMRTQLNILRLRFNAAARLFRLQREARSATALAGQKKPGAAVLTASMTRGIPGTAWGG